jgi:hypothetical protein
VSAKGQPGKAVIQAQSGRSLAFQELLQTMSAMATYEETDSSTGGEMVGAVLESETEEEMWDADEQTTINGKLLVNAEFIVHDFVVKRSNRSGMETLFPDEDGHPMYLFIRSTRISESGDSASFLPAVGEEFWWNTSAQGIVGKLFWLKEHGRLPSEDGDPVECYVKGVEAANGIVLKLRPIPKRIVRS